MHEAFSNALESKKAQVYMPSHIQYFSPDSNNLEQAGNIPRWNRAVYGASPTMLTVLGNTGANLGHGEGTAGRALSAGRIRNLGFQTSTAGVYSGTGSFVEQLDFGVSFAGLVQLQRASVAVANDVSGSWFRTWRDFRDLIRTASGINLLLDSHLDVIREAIAEFAIGLDGVKPNARVLQMAQRVSFEAARHTIDPEISVDIDGVLSFDLRLSTGGLVLAELGVDGSIDASIYHDCDRLVRRLANVTEREFVSSLTT